ncbi:MAG: hypothetical protein M1833_007366 [Piccolia ochrophora]|nr:MAG: hypothetical protein M1833_007366 [Piccolia ochrophora]
MFLAVVLCICSAIAYASATPNVIHWPITRRGGAFPIQTGVNLTYLSEQLASAASRFNLTRREIKGNKVIRKARASGFDIDEQGLLMGDIGRQGNWFAKLHMGKPVQNVEMDLNMLAWDFSVLSTTSPKGTPFVDFGSESYIMSGDYPGYPNCKQPSETVRLPTVNLSVSLSFPHCRPQKSSHKTLLPSGSMLGLGPSHSLRQTTVPSFFQQLVDKKIIDHELWSLILINEYEGVMSLGGTAAEAVAKADKATKDQLDKAGHAEKAQNSLPGPDPPDLKSKTKRGQSKVEGTEADWESKWRWSRVQGAAGWWQILMQGVWVDGSKVLKNQPAVIDVEYPQFLFLAIADRTKLNTPFILAPPLAARAFYGSISGARPMAPPYDQFYTFPCLNPPDLHFEFGRWNFPVMKGTNGGTQTKWPGSKFSLGRVKEGSGYCVGAVVETRMGVGDTREAVGQGGKTEAKLGIEAGMVNAGNGLRDVWILGEPFFRTVSTVFDFKEQRVGMRTY